MNVDNHMFLENMITNSNKEEMTNKNNLESLDENDKIKIGKLQNENNIFSNSNKKDDIKNHKNKNSLKIYNEEIYESQSESQSNSDSESETAVEQEMKNSDKKIKMYDLISESEYFLYLRYGIFPYILVIHVIIIIVIVLDTFNISYYNNTYRNHVRVISNKHGIGEKDKLFLIHSIKELKSHLTETIDDIFSYSESFIENIILLNKDNLLLEFKPTLDSSAPVLINYEIKEGEELPFIKLPNEEMRKLLSRVSEFEINLKYQTDFMEKGLNNTCIFNNIYKYNLDERSMITFKVYTNLISCFKISYALSFLEKVGLLSLCSAILGIIQISMIFKKIFQIIVFYNKLYKNKKTYTKIKKLSMADKLGLINKWLILILITDVFIILSKIYNY